MTHFIDDTSTDEFKMARSDKEAELRTIEHWKLYKQMHKEKGHSDPPLPLKPWVRLILSQDKPPDYIVQWASLKGIQP